MLLDECHQRVQRIEDQMVADLIPGERVQIGLAGETNVPPFERTRGGQQQRRSFAITTSGKRNARMSKSDLCAPEFIERSRLPGSEHRNRLFEPPCLEFSLCGLERALRSAGRIR